MSKINIDDIHKAVAQAGLINFAGTYTELGGGEVNDTFRLDFEDSQIVMRVARYEDQDTLHQEARALKLLDNNNIPRLIYFNPNHRIKNRIWILESFLPGVMVRRITAEQYYSLGQLLAKVHSVKTHETTANLESFFLDSAKRFGDENYLRNHPDEKLRYFINVALDHYFKKFQHKMEHVIPSLIHGDVTPNNMLVHGDGISLIDWEFSKFKDPMSDFATSFYEDMEYNQGKWRVNISPEEKLKLYDGYRSAGGKLDEERIKVWMNIDKLGAAIFLYWRLYVSERPSSDSESKQYQLDLENLIKSLEQNLKI